MTAFVLALASAGGHAGDAALRTQLERVAGASVFFAHQSVGANILAGLDRLAAAERVSLHVDEMLVPENGDPRRKLREFERAVDARGDVDVAMLKFCYVDIGPDTDAAALFEQYRETLARLQLRHPRTTFVHVTLPLTRVQGGLKALAKRVTGRHPYGTVENLRREEYNALLRSAYLGREPLFDLARVESVAPDGRHASVTWRGRSAPVLAEEYTEDGGHLNAEGSARAARELAAVLAAAVINRTSLRAAAAGH